MVTKQDLAALFNAVIRRIPQLVALTLVATVPGQGYLVSCWVVDPESATPNSWTNLGGAITASGGLTSAADSRTNAQRFYRLLLLP
jgi:hypothetical protein